MREGLDQRQFAVRMDWGLQGAQAIGRSADIVVIVDVLSFTTTVSVALDQGAEVFPYPWRDDSAQAFARQHRAVLAVGRSEVAAVRGPAARAGAASSKPAADVTAAGGGVAHAHPYAVSAATALNAHGSVESRPQQVSLSPASIRASPGLDRIILPSPNGSALASALVDGVEGVQVLAPACATALQSLGGSRASPAGRPLPRSSRSSRPENGGQTTRSGRPPRTCGAQEPSSPPWIAWA